MHDIGIITEVHKFSEWVSNCWCFIFCALSMLWLLQAICLVVGHKHYINFTDLKESCVPWASAM